MLTNIYRIHNAQNHGDFTMAVELARSWIAHATQPDILAAMHAGSLLERQHLASLFRDLLSGYPATRLAAPMLIHLLPWGIADEVEMPIPDPSVKLAEGLTFQGWLPAEAGYKSEPGPLVVKITGGIAPAVAVFALNPDSDAPTECANDFFSNLFRQKLILAGRLLLPLPDALDAIKLMKAASTTGNQLANRSQFLSENAREWALSTGLLMREYLANIKPRPVSSPIK